jgi:branched-chain amino acid transport system substrate-binding protein
MTSASRLSPLLRTTVVLAAGLALSLATRAELRIGVILSLTGPGASLGIPAQNTVKLWPTELAGQKVVVTVLNDETDTVTAAKDAARLLTEDKVDVIVGPSLTPTSLAVVEQAARASTPVIALGGGGAIVLPQDGPRVWAFKMSAPESVAVGRAIDDMLANHVKTVATIGITTSYGEGFLKSFEAMAAPRGIKIVATERYNQTDPGVTAQVLKLTSAQPDAVYIFSAGTPGALPQIELAKRGYKGRVYQTQGVANADYLRVGGKDLEGTVMTVAPVLVAEQLPESVASKKPALDYVKRYETAYGPNTRSLFGASAWTAWLWLEAAVPVAMKAGPPGTSAFRAALRTALETMHEVVTAEAVYNMSPKDHNGVDQRSQVLVRLEGGNWRLIK